VCACLISEGVKTFGPKEILIYSEKTFGPKEILIYSENDRLAKQFEWIKDE
jgi:hypothetical protein